MSSNPSGSPTPGIEALLRALSAWAAAEPLIDAVLLVGSHARGQARADSDVDLVILTPVPDRFTGAPRWSARFGKVERHAIEGWGDVTSVRVWYANGLEVEFGFARPSWASLPLDEGTREAIKGGFRVVFDRRGVLTRLRTG